MQNIDKPPGWSNSRIPLKVEMCCFCDILQISARTSNPLNVDIMLYYKLSQQGSQFYKC